MSERTPSPPPAVSWPSSATGVSAVPAPPSEGPPVPSDTSEGSPVRDPRPPASGPDDDWEIKRRGWFTNPGSRNLVVCIDGTSNQFSTKNTNVVEFYSRLVKNKKQLTFYNSGIGTYAKPSWKSWGYLKQVIANKLDLAFALRFEKIILSAYEWLVDNYEPDDAIYLFGFSRGAYQVRALAAMIDAVGLLHKGNNDQIPFAYELYAASDDEDKDAEPEEALSLSSKILGTMSTWVQRVIMRTTSTALGAQSSGQDYPLSMQKQFKATFSRPAHVHFVGAWDTVSSVGLIRDKTLPGTTDGMKCAHYFRHALALHEFRVKFLPEYVNGNRGPDPETPLRGIEPHTKEVWFSGSHSDIGGGSIANTTLDQFGQALRWMTHEGQLAGLRINDGSRSWTEMDVSRSMTFIWRIFEYLPIKRLSYQRWDPDLTVDDLRSRSAIKENDLPSKSATTWLPHLYAHREIQPGQRIYRPVDRDSVPFPLPKFAQDEEDAYVDVTMVLRPWGEVQQRGCVLDERNTALLKRLTTSDTGLGSLRLEEVVKYIHNMALSCWGSKAAPRILKDLRSLHTAYLVGMLRFNAKITDVDLTDGSSSGTFPFHMCGHTAPLSSVAFISDTRMISGSVDTTLRLWDVGTGERTLCRPTHSKSITCVAVHAAKGLIASASYDNTICLWTFDSKSGVRAGKVLHDERTAMQVAFSPDGSHLASVSFWGVICMWNVATGEQVGEPVRGGTCHRSVTFSSDGKRIASGSEDDNHTAQLWDWLPDEATLKPYGKSLKGHTNWVTSVAFSPDASVLASGSWDKTVRIWDVETRASKFTLDGHTDHVYSVAFAPDGTHVVSGSKDWTVRIWDAGTGTAVRVLLGHTESVMSVAISPDGTRIASGSKDNTVRVWDFDPHSDAPLRDEGEHAPSASIEPA